MVASVYGETEKWDFVRRTRKTNNSRYKYSEIERRRGRLSHIAIPELLKYVQVHEAQPYQVSN